MTRLTEDERFGLEVELGLLEHWLKEAEANLAAVESPDYVSGCDEGDEEACRERDRALYEDEIGEIRKEMGKIERKLGLEVK